MRFNMGHAALVAALLFLALLALPDSARAPLELACRPTGLTRWSGAAQAIGKSARIGMLAPLDGSIDERIHLQEKLTEIDQHMQNLAGAGLLSLVLALWLIVPLARG